MLHAPVAGGLEVRAEGDGSQIIAGRFPYGVEAELSPGRRETIAPGAFAARVNNREAEIHLLTGHDFDRPLASRRAGTLTVTDGEHGLDFEARIAPEVAGTSHGRDTLALVSAGLSVGLSPGFRLSREGESIQRRPDGVLRTIRSAELFELSVVTRPAYDQAQVEARRWQPEGRRVQVPAAWRWR